MIPVKTFSFTILIEILAAFFLFMPSAHAANPGDVVINEIAWMGTEASTSDEWIELYNTTASDIDLTGWTLDAADGTPNITLSGTIPAHGYFLLERTEDDTIPTLTEDQIYTGALENGGESLTLADSGSNTIDTANSDGGAWPAGTNSPRASMERISPFLPDADANWQTSTGNANNARDRGGNLIIGTPKGPSSPAGAGRALDFDGVDDNVVVSDTASLDLSSTGTLEAWIHVNSFLDDGGIIHKGDNSDSSDAAYELKLGTTGANTTLVFTVYDTSGTPYSVSSVTTIDTHKWYHVAAVWDSSVPSMTLYINGISDATGNTAAARATTGNLHIGSRFTGGGDPFSGDIDEVRIWNIARTESEIRDDMCRKLAGNESGLVAYFRFDKSDTSTSCPDFTGNGNTGTMTNMDPGTDRIVSEAAIGDASAYDYNGSTATDFTQTLSHPDGDSLTVTGDGGTWDASTDPKSGLQVYRVDISPAILDIPVYWNLYKKASHYWGVFVTGGTNPTYSVTYDYSGLYYPDETRLRMGMRHNTSDFWIDSCATLDTTNNTLTKTGLSGTQFLLGSLVDPKNAILFTAANSEYVTVPYDASLDATANNAVTVEAWVKKTSAQTGQVAIVQMDNSYNLHFTSGNQPEFTIYSGGTPYSATFGTGLDNDKWYHLAGTFDGSNVNIFVDGYNRGSSSASVTIDNSANDVGIGGNVTSASNYLDGTIDEVRIWNVARTDAEIRDTMCRTISGTETGLVAYWRFDKESDTDTTCPDYTANGNDGTLTASNVGLARVLSEAPIGDASAYDYSGTSASNFSITLTHPDGDNATATGDGGTWNDTTLYSGLQVYRVDEPPVYPPDIFPDSFGTGYTYVTPNGLTPPYPPNAATNWSSIDYYRYWGVFVTGGTNPTFTFEYNYGGNPNEPDDETVLGLATRENYGDRTWADSGASLDTSANTLTTTANAMTTVEYVLGGKDAPLAITLVSFTATAEDDHVHLRWETSFENGTEGFYVLRSTNKNKGYERLVGSYQNSRAENPASGAVYTYDDYSVDQTTTTTYYYRLEEEDGNPGVENTIYDSPSGNPVSVTFPPGNSESNGTSATCFIMTAMETVR